MGDVVAKILLIGNSKGGVGKTTTACQLAGTFGHRGFDVLLADLDEQQTASAWAAKMGGQNFPAAAWSGYRYEEKIAVELGKLAGKYQIIVVDCAPAVDKPSTWGAMLVSDLIIIPTKLNPTDIDALPSAKRLAKRAVEKSGRDIPIRVLGTAFRRGRADDKLFLEDLETDTEIPVLAAKLGDRTAFSRSMLYGATAHSLPNSKEAVTELDSLADEILGLMDMPKTNGDL